MGEPLSIVAQLGEGRDVRLASPEPLVEALKHPLTEESLREQLGRLGSTNYELRHLDANIQGRPMLPLSVLGKLRHEMVARLDAMSRAVPARGVCEGSALDTFGDEGAKREDAGEPALRVLCRGMNQLRAVLSAGVRNVYVDFADIREYREAVEESRAANAEIFLATPRIQKPGEVGIFTALSKHGADGILVRNFGGLAFYVERDIPVIADYSLNATNELTVAWLRQRGAGRVTVSYDLNREQLLDLVGAAPVAELEVVMHQHMPMFHMEHCVFCAVLSPGTNKHNCGRPCDVHQVRLRDRVGMEHPLTADVGCRNTLFNATPQSAAEVVPELLHRGVKHFRVELLESQDINETPALLGLYRNLLSGAVSGGEVWRALRASNRVGVTRGALEERRNPLAIL